MTQFGASKNKTLIWDRTRLHDKMDKENKNYFEFKRTQLDIGMRATIFLFGVLLFAMELAERNLTFMLSGIGVMLIAYILGYESITAIRVQIFDKLGSELNKKEVK